MVMNGATVRCRFKWALIFLSFAIAQTSAAHAQAEGSFLENLVEHLATHFGMAIAEGIVNRVLHGENRTSDFQISEEALNQLVYDKLKVCIERAKWLDDHNPQRPHYLRDKSNLDDPFYAHDVELYHTECDHIVNPQ